MSHILSKIYIRKKSVAVFISHVHSSGVNINAKTLAGCHVVTTFTTSQRLA